MRAPTVADWHAQFARQAGWTQALRSQLYRRAGLLQAERVLDVGCGTGAITEELAQRTRGTATGLDINPECLAFARQQPGRARYEQGNALSLPYPAQHFDIVCCHFLLMWVGDPARAVREMARVLRRDGTVLICAEPDYGGRLDWPDLPIRQWQIDGLRRAGSRSVGRASTAGVVGPGRTYRRGGPLPCTLGRRHRGRGLGGGVVLGATRRWRSRRCCDA